LEGLFSTLMEIQDFSWPEKWETPNFNLLFCENPVRIK